MPVRITRTIYRRDGSSDVNTSEGHASFEDAVEVGRAQVRQYETQLLADNNEPNICKRHTRRNTMAQKFGINLLGDARGFEVSWVFESY